MATASLIQDQAGFFSNENENTTTNNGEQINETKNKERQAKLRDAALAGSGIVAGGVVGAAIVGGIESVNQGETTPDDPIATNTTNSGAGQHATVNSEIPIAHSVNDSMSYDEAFASARHEVGPGGGFEWRGQWYGTYYAHEWNALSQEQRLQFSNNLVYTLDHSSTSADVTANNPSAATSVQGAESTTEQGTESTTNQEAHTQAGASTTQSDLTTTQSDLTTTQAAPTNAQPESVTQPEPGAGQTFSLADANSVEVLSIDTINTGQGFADAAHLSVDGSNVFLLDVDRDGIYDQVSVNNALAEALAEPISYEQIAPLYHPSTLIDGSDYSISDYTNEEPMADYINDAPVGDIA